MTITEKIGKSIQNHFDGQEVTISMDTKHKQITIKFSTVSWRLDIVNRNSGTLWRNQHFYMRFRSALTDIAQTIQDEHIKMLDQDEIRQVGEGLCRYLQDDGTLPEGFKVISVTSSLAGGIMSIVSPQNTLLAVKTIVDPPKVMVHANGSGKEFNLSDPECAKQVMNYIALYA